MASRTGADVLSAWLRLRARLAGRIVAPEEALLTGRFARYAARRLTAFALARGWATALHILELTWLAEVFYAKSFVASLALQNLTLVLDAAYWGALEAMRRRARELGPSSEAAAMVTRWLTVAIWAGAAIALVPIARAVWAYADHAQTPSMLHVYALACAFRLGADIVVRTYYSGVYAYRRVHRPLWSVFVGPIALVGGTLLLWRPLAGWSFPLALVLSVILSRALLYRFTRRAYRLQRVPPPLWRLGLRLRRPVWSMTRAAILAALANTTTRLGGVVLLAAVIPSLSITVDESEMPIVEPFAMALHLASPLVLVASQWGLVFYHDYKRVEDEGSAMLARGLHRRLLEASVVVGVVAWAGASALVLLYVPYAEARETLLALLPSTVGLSIWTALQLRGFARGDFARQAASAAAMLAVLAVVVSFPRDPSLDRAPASWYLALAAGPWTAIAIHAALAFVEDAHATGQVLTFANFARALRASPRDVVVWRAAVERRAPLVAARIAAELGARGAVVRSGNRLYWFEREPTTRAAWLRTTAGMLTDLTSSGPAGGRLLLEGLAREATGDAEALSVLSATHARLFPEGFVVAVMRRAPARFLALSPAVRQAIWRDGLRDHRGGRAGGRSGFHVTAYGPRGAIEALFVIPRPVPPAAAGQWRGALRKCGWQVHTDADADIVGG